MERKGKKKESMKQRRKASSAKAVLGTDIALDSLKAASQSAVPPGAGLPWQAWGRGHMCANIFRVRYL